MRSRTGCLTCRQRKLKCDEKKPVCRQCAKASRECIPSPGIVFRHQQNASMNGEDSTAEKSLKGFYAYKNTFDKDAMWVDIPKCITFVTTTNLYLDSGVLELDTMLATSMESPKPFEPHCLASWRTQGDRHPIGNVPSSLRSELAPSSVSCCLTQDVKALSPQIHSSPGSVIERPVSPPMSLFNPHIGLIMNLTTSSAMPSTDSFFSLPFDSTDYMPRPVSRPRLRWRPPRPNASILTQDEHEIACLLQWFSEGPGYWMDLFITGTYFASHVPVEAVENPLLKYAIAACAAKAFARVQDQKPAMGGSSTRQAGMKHYPNVPLVDWEHKTAVYYNTTVSMLLQALNGKVASSPNGSKCELRQRNGDPACAYNVSAPKPRRISQNTSFVPSTEELLVVIAILCFYEFLDTSISEWEKHLHGAKSFLVLSQQHIRSLRLPNLASPMFPTSSKFASKAWRAVFWNIARQDMLAAFINKTSTRLDTDDLTLWREAGLILDEQACIMPSNAAVYGYLEEGDAMIKEELICNTLVWLMVKLVNFMAVGSVIPSRSGAAWDGVVHRTRFCQWFSLRKQFQVWHEGLPVTFRPSARVAPSHTSGQVSNDDSASMFSEAWHSMPMCASTMQTYYMSQILLFMNKPHESTLECHTELIRMSYHQSVLAACQIHSRRIIGISLAQPDKAVRVHSVQPLFTAGQCLSDNRECQIVLRLLRDIESDTGWATDYRVQQLVEQWQRNEPDSQALWSDSRCAIPHENKYPSPTFNTVRLQHGSDLRSN
uniref:Transcription activator AMTR1 n=1 Tax=Alternaria alternata TaxID=5599 RepID=AMTR1_ALTAL|nr:RecName: Full=Transcription activator AMTR1; AltName: Full=AM-toxin biosynthesis regulator 1 [Alternaria alternata]BAI44746.1 Zn(II)2Cys6 transcription factor [Alternaria alternata]